MKESVGLFVLEQTTFYCLNNDAVVDSNFLTELVNVAQN